MKQFLAVTEQNNVKYVDNDVMVAYLPHSR